MLWWVSDADRPLFFAWGYGGQFCMCRAEQDS